MAGKYARGYDDEDVHRVQNEVSDDGDPSSFSAAKFCGAKPGGPTEKPGSPVSKPGGPAEKPVDPAEKAEGSAESPWGGGGGGGEAIRSEPGTKPTGGAAVTNPGASAAETKPCGGTGTTLEAASS